MNCIVTAGPTYESLDQVRRLTNFSTGRLGSELANFLTARGHHVVLLLGQSATHPGPQHASHVERFTTSADLRDRLRAFAARPVDALFHAAAVSDFSFGKICTRSASGELAEIKSGKISTRLGTLLAELVPTPKIIAELRAWYPATRLIGWKFEVDGDRPAVLAQAERQLADYHTDACVANGPAHGPGFSLVKGPRLHTHLADSAALFAALDALIKQ